MQGTLQQELESCVMSTLGTWAILQICEHLVTQAVTPLNRRGICYLFLLQKDEGLYLGHLNISVPYILP